MATNNEELRALLLSISAQLDTNDSAPAVPDGDKLPELAELLGDGNVHPFMLRTVLLQLDGRLKAIEAPAVDAPAPAVDAEVQADATTTTVKAGK